MDKDNARKRKGGRLILFIGNAAACINSGIGVHSRYGENKFEKDIDVTLSVAITNELQLA